MERWRKIEHELIEFLRRENADFDSERGVTSIAVKNLAGGYTEIELEALARHLADTLYP